ncbi:SDR family NAD(P)-dependent oxidoreductase [Candidatus Lucifugimonas marina]|uniref:SDR family oxidoreductase n=1 Tax=Candidatus Lucifugimonas marina TaxID=3038979 RepID=A0AAJ5ZDZ3_9CHLR|nr:SDR family oxidoreductase [SAR202 cluster bacterium JH639]WFG35546.1 SDR family oxidoreductase [SAR202 cluster bacterium JH545]WFG39493.1 SDR family oxidoreductase [SAR202 cluster bacterium JH1073]
MGNRLEGKVAIITGGNSGIGEGTAHLFAKEGAKVVIMARRDDEGKAVQAAIRAEGGDATFISCDVGDEEMVNAAVEQAAETYGGIDILFNNAGGGAGEHFPNESSSEFTRVINTNLNGTLYMSQAVWPHLVKAGSGAVVNMSSVAAVRGTSPKMHEKFGSTSSSYWAAKAGVDAMTRYMAGIGGADKIRVNGVRPGQIMTPQATRGTINDDDGGHHAFEGMFELMQMLEGPGYPIDVANLVLFLVSDESRFITGQIVHIDGGVPVKI